MYTVEKYLHGTECRMEHGNRVSSHRRNNYLTVMIIRFYAEGRNKTYSQSGPEPLLFRFGPDR